MPYKPQYRRRPWLRLPGYDYSQPGAYFVTIVTYQREMVFGMVQGGVMQLNPCGQVVADFWARIPHHHPHAILDAFIVMPNHVHGVLILSDQGWPCTRTGVSKIMQGFKKFTARRVQTLRDTHGVPLWQRSFYDRIVRNDDELQRIRSYIADNPLNWTEDYENPNRDT